MPLFTRRRLQSMLDDIASQAGSEKARDLLSRLEDKRIDQVLPAEIELALLWVLSQIGDIDIEPHWWGDEKRPDAYTESLVAGEPAVIEIAAPNDNAINGEAAMDGVALQISSFASSLQRGLGNYLYFRFREESGYDRGVYFRRRLAPIGYELGVVAKAQLRNWIGSGASTAHRLRIIEPDLDVEVERKVQKQTRFHNIWSSMPAETHSLEGNPLYKLLVRKLRQLRAARPGTRRFIFLGDAGSTLLNRLGRGGDLDPMRRRVSGQEILSHFVAVNREAVDSVEVFAPVRQRSLMGKEELRWTVTVFNRPDFTFHPAPLGQLMQSLPRPRLEGYQTRSLFRQGRFGPKARGWWLGLTIQSRRGGPMEVKISTRAVFDLLAGRVSPEQFRYMMGEKPGEKNRFEHWLDKGLTVRGVRFEPGGVDQDDDMLLLTLGDDPAARTLRLPDDAPDISE